MLFNGYFWIFQKNFIQCTNFFIDFEKMDYNPFF